MERDFSQSDPEAGSRGATSAGDSPQHPASPTALAHSTTTQTLRRPVATHAATVRVVGNATASPPGGAAAAHRQPASNGSFVPNLPTAAHTKSPSERSALDVVLNAPSVINGAPAALDRDSFSDRSLSHRSGSAVPSRAGSPIWGPPRALGYAPLDAASAGAGLHHSSQRPQAGAHKGGVGGGSQSSPAWLSPATASTSSLPPLPQGVSRTLQGGAISPGGGALPSPSRTSSHRALEPLSQAAAGGGRSSSSQGFRSTGPHPFFRAAQLSGRQGGDPLPQPEAREAIPRINHSEHMGGRNRHSGQSVHIGARTQLRSLPPAARPPVLSDEPGVVAQSSLGGGGLDFLAPAAASGGAASGTQPKQRPILPVDSLPQVESGPTAKSGEGGLPAAAGGVDEPLPEPAIGSAGHAGSITPLHGRCDSSASDTGEFSPPAAPLRCRPERLDTFAGAAGIEGSEDEDDPA